jgi:hypothetical protein
MVDYQLFQKVIFSPILLFLTFTDRYEVLFFDGFTKNIKGIRMSKLEGDADKMAEVRSDLVLILVSFTVLILVSFTAVWSIHHLQVTYFMGPGRE